MLTASQDESPTVTRCPPPCYAGVALMQGTLMAQKHEHIPSLPLGEGRTTHLSHYAVPVRCTAPCILQGWQRGISRHSVLSSTSAKVLRCPCMLWSRSWPLIRFSLLIYEDTVLKLMFSSGKCLVSLSLYSQVYRMNWQVFPAASKPSPHRRMCGVSLI